MRCIRDYEYCAITVIIHKLCINSCFQIVLDSPLITIRINMQAFAHKFASLTAATHLKLLVAKIMSNI